ncbi:MAG: ABC transporter substrate-binding protein, partial [Chloroflexota bacterium]|nr:ABC transporter substrate-binding protein [Chloroflexota bacterium]
AGWTVGENGVRQKNGQPLKIVLEVDKGNPVREQTAVFAQQYWQEIGAEVEIKTSQFNDLLARIRAGDDADVQSWIMWYITPPHPDVTAYYGCGNSTNTFHYCNERVDAILAEARSTADIEKQAQLYKDMSAIIAEDGPIAFLYYPYELQAIRANVQNWPQLGYRDALNHIIKVWEQ